MKHPFAHLREAFPILEHKTYLASHSLGAVPTATQGALQEYYDAWAQDGILAWEGPWYEAIGTFTHNIERVLRAPSGTVVPMTNATRAMAAVASCFDWSGNRDKIVLTDLEFTTSYPLWRGLERLGAQVEIVESPDGITVPTQDLIEAIDERTRIVPTSHVYFRSGAIQDLATVARAAHEKGAFVLGDGYQAVGTVPVDVQALDVDFYVGGSHKWLCGGPGAGYLYVRESLVGQLRPRLTGWFGLESTFEYEFDAGPGMPARGVERFLGGTPAIPALFAAREGIATVRRAGIPDIRAYSQKVTQALLEEVEDRGWTVSSPQDPADRSGMLCFQHPDGEAKVKALEAQGIIVDHRPDCGIRVSPHFYNTWDEVETFLDALEAA
ncbi:MAG: aminotransferase class V-fold PLP-dependent enzyme [Candidatus Thermoplasmatota archaeon]|nr:aminotransferase class V-fold PLP-dependent enzyme [Candidatus Thermoplasmatota archaeon]